MSTPATPTPSLFDPEHMATRLYEELDRVYKSNQMIGKLASNQINVPVGQSPKELIWTLNKLKLHHYYPLVPKEKRHPVPLLLVFALINRPYIFDLRPGNSFVEFLLNKGYEVYVLDWGTPGLEDAGYNFEDFALRFLPRVVRQVQRHSGSKAFSMLGWCIGAAISTIYAAMRPDDGLRNLLLLTAPLDFSDKEAGPFSRWLNTDFYNVDELVARVGNVPPEIIEYGNKMLKPVENYIGTYLKLWDNLDNPQVVESWMAMNTWVTDNVPFPGAAFRQWVQEFFRENRLMENKLVMDGRIVDLANLKANMLNIVATSDHIVPNCQSRSVMDRIGSEDKTLLEVKGGHIGIMIGSGAVKRLWPQMDAWLSVRSE